MTMGAGLPIFEVASILVGLLAGALTTWLTSKHKENNSHLLLEALSKSRSWKEFEDSRLKEILRDREINDAEWREILTALDQIVIEVSKEDREIEENVKYSARSERSKKLLVSGMLQELAA